ncbi:P-loop containing nucleoside triphosphate hydrolase protein [Annulohypoxylon maeteangense]|uniref:P-loop containing nucleoside triphosphate hydrolase protein n=1 Tax=Annulohypoxylon maeteangense TaxID=1927788 RepID=UPI002008A13E|nr:P-loop containing nucleoside triphosphate hydrolase protein [Annulohypoxylon maeteangense]KAI0880036.1 P-loop containing nucleoside triphosphate hydrolase protein [Annulohypoxylon maeteangense]
MQSLVTPRVSSSVATGSDTGTTNIDYPRDNETPSPHSPDRETKDILNELMGYEGLISVKQQFLDILSKIITYREQGRDLKSERFNAVFLGNPGTGKTSIARLYAKFLCSIGLLESDYVEERSGMIMATQSSRDIDTVLEELVDRMDGGILLIDEASRLVSQNTNNPGLALDLILTAMENNVGKLVVIFVGYKDDMESFFEYNPRLSSRIPYIVNFEDFTNRQLKEILCGTINSQYSERMKVEGGLEGLYIGIAVNRLARGRGSRGFGNAHAVHNLLAQISQRQARRLEIERQEGKRVDYFFFTKEDLIGPEPSLTVQATTAWNKLNTLIGLEGVKDSVRIMIDTLQQNYCRELKRHKPIALQLNQIFVGQPGTGKTTVAKLYGQILADLGYLSRGDVVLKTPTDFIGDCLGQSEVNTRKILDASIGRVLVIDDAYMLDPGDSSRDQDKFKTGVIDTMISMIHGETGEDRCIILVGYEDRIQNMFHNANPGFSRRFPVEQPFRFENFDVNQLEQILRLKLKEQHLACTSQAIDVAREAFKRALMRPNFTNAGVVNEVLGVAKMNYMRRKPKVTTENDSIDEFQAVDFDIDFHTRPILDLRNTLENLVHSSVTDKLVGYQRRHMRAIKRGLSPRGIIPTRFVFKGASGTGKAMTAQTMAELFHDMGFLSMPSVIECSATDLIGQYVGHAVPQTRRKLQEAVGRILFVDEANRLNTGPYATEAVDEIVRYLSQPANQCKIIVILAGDRVGMDQLMKRPALSNLFTEEIVFENIPPDNCIALLNKELECNGFVSEANFLTNASSEGYSQVREHFRNMQTTQNWSNARDVKNLANEIIGRVLELDDETQDMRTISVTQATSCMAQVFARQKSRSVTANTTIHGTSPHAAFPGPHEPWPDLKQLLPSLQRLSSNTSTSRVAHSHFTNADVDIAVRGNNQPTQDAQMPRIAINHNQQRKKHEDVEREDGSAETETKVQDAQRKAQIHDLQEKLQKVGDKLVNTSEEEEMKGLSAECDILSKKLEALRQREEEEKRIQDKLKKMGKCEYGYNWTQVDGGYRCEGGSHFTSDAELQSR